MKYLLTVLYIILAITAVTVFYLWPSSEISKEDVLLTINGHDLPRKLLDQKKNQSGYHSQDDKSLLDAIIINELLLQEAQRMGIDKEPEFRVSIQNYYEQSLIKVLIDRQFSTAKNEATDKDIDQFISNYGKIITFTRQSDKSVASNKEKPLQKSVLFDDLSDSLKFLFSGMEIGDVSTDFYTGNEVVSYRLDKIESGSFQEPFAGNRESIKMKITNYKKERALMAWIKKLRSQAIIIHHDETEKP